jgi:hypothetical protein
MLLGDFNVIMGAHEHYGNTPPAIPPIRDFQQWTNLHDLIHLPTRGVSFTWDNGRLGRRHTKKILDRAICNQQMLDLCSSISCSTLTKTRSDHYPLLFEFHTNNQILKNVDPAQRLQTTHL